MTLCELDLAAPKLRYRDILTKRQSPPMESAGRVPFERGHGSPPVNVVFVEVQVKGDVVLCSG